MTEYKDVRSMLQAIDPSAIPGFDKAVKEQEMLDKCLHCCRKHLRKAMVLWLEARLGHPEKWDVALGNLAEAADAVVLIDESFALYIRELYLRYDADRSYVIDWKIVFENLDALKES